MESAWLLIDETWFAARENELFYLLRRILPLQVEMLEAYRVPQLRN